MHSHNVTGGIRCRWRLNLWSFHNFIIVLMFCKKYNDIWIQCWKLVLLCILYQANFQLISPHYILLTSQASIPMLMRTTFGRGCAIRRPCFTLRRHGLSLWGPRFEFRWAGFDLWRPTFEIRRSDLDLWPPNINSVLFWLPFSSFVCNSLFLGRHNVCKVTCATWSFLS